MGAGGETTDRYLMYREIAPGKTGSGVGVSRVPWFQPSA
jgi:hypothetical protein